MSVSYLTDLSQSAPESKSIRVYDVVIDGSLTGPAGVPLVQGDDLGSAGVTAGYIMQADGAGGVDWVSSDGASVLFRAHSAPHPIINVASKLSFDTDVYDTGDTGLVYAGGDFTSANGGVYKLSFAGTVDVNNVAQNNIQMRMLEDAFSFIDIQASGTGTPHYLPYSIVSIRNVAPGGVLSMSVLGSANSGNVLTGYQLIIEKIG